MVTNATVFLNKTPFCSSSTESEGNLLFCESPFLGGSMKAQDRESSILLWQEFIRFRQDVSS